MIQQKSLIFFLYIEKSRTICKMQNMNHCIAECPKKAREGEPNQQQASSLKSISPPKILSSLLFMNKKCSLLTWSGDSLFLCGNGLQTWTPLEKANSRAKNKNKKKVFSLIKIRTFLRDISQELSLTVPATQRLKFVFPAGTQGGQLTEEQHRRVRWCINPIVRQSWASPALWLSLRVVSLG